VFKKADNQQLPLYNAERDAQTVAFMVRGDEDLFYYEDEKVQVGFAVHVSQVVRTRSAAEEEFGKGR
jgi:uncharacterized protein YneR